MRKLLIPILIFFLSHQICFAGGTITDGNSTFMYEFDNITPPERFGIYKWMLTTTGVDHEYQHWFWYRLNGSDTREYPMPIIVSSESYIGNTATLNWVNVDGKGFDATVTIVINQLAPGIVNLSSTCTITNNNQSTIDVEVFANVDHDIIPSFFTNEAILYSAGVIELTDPNSSDVFYFSAPDHNAFEVNHPYQIAQIGNRPDLFNNSITTLTNSGLPYGPEDFNVTYSWNHIIAPFNSASSEVIMQSNLPPGTPIPTLSQWGIIALSMILLIFGVVALKPAYQKGRDFIPVPLQGKL